ncbi:sigma-70 family RNA polymerase sigma factor [Mesorhizobium sp. J8]|uniref:sigma-70 family RNA polymerase sigma factor n=1 Tax=Mesorhizobium sp. J8 TaxID=2777475 RepID=UPI001915D089
MASLSRPIHAAGRNCLGDQSVADSARVFDVLRPKLRRISYRLLGAVADAEDVVQEAFVRWLNVDQSTVREPEAYLRQIVTRLSLNTLKSARRRREVYVGTWLPEPIIATEANSLEVDAEDDFTLPLMIALERLSPLKRAAFILHDAFDIGFDEVAKAIGRNKTACGQLAKRARSNIRIARPRFPLDPKHGLEIAEAFYRASRAGNMDQLQELLAEDVTVYVDGGGKVRATTKPLAGAKSVLRFYHGLAKIRLSLVLNYGIINGLPGFVTQENDVVQATALQIEDGKIVAIYAMRNPDKLKHLDVPTLQ